MRLVNGIQSSPTFLKHAKFPPGQRGVGGTSLFLTSFYFPCPFSHQAVTPSTKMSMAKLEVIYSDHSISGWVITNCKQLA